MRYETHLTGTALLAAIGAVTLGHSVQAVDCNGNGIEDDVEIQEASTFTSASGEMSPFGAGFPRSLEVLLPPSAIGDVELFFKVSADLDAGNEKVDLFVDGQDFGQILNSADHCSSPPDTDVVTIPASEWNAFAADGTVTIAMIPNSNVDSNACSPPSFISVAVTYPILPHNDLDHNGVLDVCQTLRRPEGSVLTHSDLAVRYYYDLNNPSSMPNFAAMTPSRLGTVPHLNFAGTSGEFAGSGRSANVGAVFTGFITVPAPDFYFFYLTSDDGSRLYIGNQLVVDNDGVHPMSEAQGAIGLEAGTHAIRVEFFERTGEAGLIASIEGGGLAKQVIPAAMFSHGGGCAGDANADGVVDFSDLLTVLSNWGECEIDPCFGDLDHDWMVGFSDLLAVTSHWGPCPPDVMIDSIVLSTNDPRSDDTISVSVGLYNTSAEPTMAILFINVLEGGSWQTPIVIAPGDNVEEVVIHAPTLEAVAGGCGTPLPYDVEVSIQPIGVDDANPDNNFETVAIDVTPDYWDLRFQVSISPAFNLWGCFPINWQVTVTNIGNVTSDSVSYRTAICRDSGSGDWSPCWYGDSDASTGGIPSGWSETFNHQKPGGLCVPIGSHYVKVQALSNDCPNGDNYDQTAIGVSN